MHDFRTRAGGLLLIVLGAIVAWFFLLGPLREAHAGVPEVRYQLKAFLLVPLCVVFGIAFLLGGSGLNYRDVERRQLTLTGWLLFAVIAVLTAVGYWWLQQQFAELGYR
jgi:lysylphosphatidylglycerol synthetase-like protein (DUF2156 family)